MHKHILDRKKTIRYANWSFNTITNISNDLLVFQYPTERSHRYVINLLTMPIGMPIRLPASWWISPPPKPRTNRHLTQSSARSLHPAYSSLVQVHKHALRRIRLTTYAWRSVDNLPCDENLYGHFGVSLIFYWTCLLINQQPVDFSFWCDILTDYAYLSSISSPSNSQASWINQLLCR